MFAQTGLQAYECLLVSPFSIPRTSSGKLRRKTCADLYLSGQLKPIASSLNDLHSEKTTPTLDIRIEKVKKEPNHENIETYLQKILELSCGI